MDRGAPRQTGVFVVDGRELLRLGISALLAVQATDLEVVGEAARAADVLARIRATRPDIVLLGEHLPDDADRTHAGLCRRLRAEPDPPRCLLLASAADDRARAAAEHAGAAGWVRTDIHGAELVGVLRRLALGEPLHQAPAHGHEYGLGHGSRNGPGEPADLAPPEPARPPDPLAGLRPTDRKIVGLIGAGLTNRQIGARLGLSERTIKNHVSQVLAVLGMERRTQVAALSATLSGPLRPPGGQDSALLQPEV